MKIGHSVGGLQELTPEKAWAFRITHVDNLKWIAGNGLHCQSSPHKDPTFVPIGNAELIGKRTYRQVKVPPFGTLADYVPFYFTPKSMMMYNIKTGYNVPKQSNSSIAILVTSIPKVVEDGVPFLFTDRHAYTQFSEFTSDVTKIPDLAWKLWQNVDFKRDNDDLGKTDRYQAELLVHKHLPVTSVLGVAACNTSVRDQIGPLLVGTALEGKAYAMPSWYF